MRSAPDRDRYSSTAMNDRQTFEFFRDSRTKSTNKMQNEISLELELNSRAIYHSSTIYIIFTSKYKSQTP